MPEVLVESAAKQYVLQKDESTGLYDRIMLDLNNAVDVFKERNDAGQKCYDFYSNRQWTTEEVEAHEIQKRIPYVFNEIQHKVDHLVGTQTQTRLDARCLPRDQGDEQKAELLSFIVKWVEQLNNLEQIESAVFLDSLLRGAGAAVIRWEMEDVNYGYPKIEKIPIYELCWDVNSKKQDLSDARWMARMMLVSKFEAAEMMPEHSEVIESASDDMSSDIGWDFDSLKTRRQKQLTSMMAEDESREMIRIIEYYERMKIYRYIIADDISGAITPFDKKEEATAFYEGLTEEYTEQGTPMSNPDGSSRVVFVTNTVDKLQQTIVVGTEIVESNITTLNDFPFVVNFAYFVDGDYWGFVDSLISPQLLVNRSFSQWDYQLGASTKNMMTVVETWLKRGFTIEDIRKELALTVAILPVQNHQAIQAHPNTPINPELFQAINFGINRMNDYAGGRNALGLQENAAESGRAVIARAEAGGMSRLPMFDRLRLWRQNITYRMVWFVKNYMPAGQIIRVIGNERDLSYIPLDDDVMESLREIKIDIIVDEVVKSETMKERYFEMMKELFQSIPVPPEVAVPILLEFSPLPESKKSEINSNIEIYKRYKDEQAEQEREAKLLRETQDSLRKQELKEVLERADSIAEAEKQVEQKYKAVKSKLDDIDKIEEGLRQGATSPLEKNKMYSKLNTPEEIREGLTSNIQNL